MTVARRSNTRQAPIEPATDQERQAWQTWSKRSLIREMNRRGIKHNLTTRHSRRVVLDTLMAETAPVARNGS